MTVSLEIGARVPAARNDLIYFYRKGSFHLWSEIFKIIYKINVDSKSKQTSERKQFLEIFIQIFMIAESNLINSWRNSHKWNVS